MEAETPEEAMLFPTTVGEKLRTARLARNLTLEEIAASTRIPQRHLEAIEASNYSGLPSITYAMGFTKALARAVGADEAAIAKDLRIELAGRYAERAAPTPSYEAQDPRRLPPRGLAIAGTVIAVLLLVGVGLYFGTDLFRVQSQADNAPLVVPTPTPAPTPAPTPTAIAATAQVVLTATDSVWVRIHDASGKTLYEKTMGAGESYAVPADANQPMLVTGRPDLLTVSVNGSNLPPLGTAKQSLKDVVLTAPALQARAAGTPAPTPTPNATAVPPRVSTPAAGDSPQPKSPATRSGPTAAPTQASPPPAIGNVAG